MRHSLPHLVALFLGSLVLPATAAVTVYEGFDYGTGLINGANGGMGLAGAWSSNGSGPSFTWDAPGFVQTSGLTFGNLEVSGAAATFSAVSGTNDSGAMYRSLGSSYGSNFTVYGSYLFNASGETTPWAGFTLGNGQTWYNDASGRFGVATPYDGASDMSTFSSYFLGNSYSSGSAMNMNETYMYLFKFSKSGSSASGSMAWVLSADQFANFKASGDLLTESELNSANIGSGASDVIARMSYNSNGSGSIASAFDTVTFDARNFFTASARTITVDELRFSDTSLDELTPLSAVPEPSKSVLLLGGLCAAMARRRRAAQA